VPTKSSASVPYQSVELAGVRYAILRESLLVELCRRAGLPPPAAQTAPAPPDTAAETLDTERLAERLAERRKRAGLTQAQLAERAGVRVETLNRVERGKTTPDFSTIRKLVTAMNDAEAAQDRAALAGRRA